MQRLDWDNLISTIKAARAGRYDVSEFGLAIKFTGGFMDGSIGVLERVSVRKPSSSYANTKLRVSALQFKVDKKRTITEPYYHYNTLHHKGSELHLFEGYFDGPVDNIVPAAPKDCFDAEYAVDKIVAYKRDNKQIFGVVESINEEGRIKLRRIYNKTRQKNDYINFKMAHENLIIDDSLLNKLLLMRLKTE